MIKCSTFLAIQEIKLLLKFILPQKEWPSSIKQIIKITGKVVLWGKKNLWRLLVEMSTSTSTVEINMDTIQKIKTRDSILPSYCFSRYFHKKVKHIILEMYLHSHIYNCKIHNSWILQAAYMSNNRWTDKENAFFIQWVLLCYKVIISKKKKKGWTSRPQ